MMGRRRDVSRVEALDPVVSDDEPAHEDASGDIELIRWHLSLTPTQRLAVLQDFVDTFWTPQHG